MDLKIQSAGFIWFIWKQQTLLAHSVVIICTLNAFIYSQEIPESDINHSEYCVSSLYFHEIFVKKFFFSFCLNNPKGLLSGRFISVNSLLKRHSQSIRIDFSGDQWRKIHTSKQWFVPSILDLFLRIKWMSYTEAQATGIPLILSKKSFWFSYLTRNKIIPFEHHFGMFCLWFVLVISTTSFMPLNNSQFKSTRLTYKTSHAFWWWFVIPSLAVCDIFPSK